MVLGRSDLGSELLQVAVDPAPIWPSRAAADSPGAVALWYQWAWARGRS